MTVVGEFTIRVPTMDDVEGVAALINACAMAEYGVPELMTKFWRGRPAQSRDFLDVVTDEHSITQRWYQLQQAAERERQKRRGARIEDST